MAYDVVLLVEQALNELDARQVHSLHTDVDDTVSYHVLLPVEDAALRVEAAMGTLSTGELLGTPSMVGPGIDEQALEKELEDNCRSELAASIKVLTHEGAKADGDTVSNDPVEALLAKVKAVDAREVIVMTRPHVVAEFFHLDWSSRARRKLGVPVLHLIEHETFDEQAGEGEGITGA